jgi:hypothetical protein
MAHAIGAGRALAWMLLAAGGLIAVCSQAAAQNAKVDQEAAEPEPARPKPGQEVSEEYFKWLERKVGFDCQQQIKRGVAYNMRSEGILYGTNEMDSIKFILRFDRWSKLVSNENTITIAGDKAEIQNGLGNWVRASYRCKANIDTKTVVDASVSSGRLPD